MSDFDFLKQYKLADPKDQEARKGLKHNFYEITQTDIDEIRTSIMIPRELEQFWLKIGYGFMHTIPQTSIYRMLDPNSFKIINLKEDYYEFDPDLELYDHYPNRLIFFEVNEGVCLMISKTEESNENYGIYYFDEKIADSLEEFFQKFDQDERYFESND